MNTCQAMSLALHQCQVYIHQTTDVRIYKLLQPHQDNSSIYDILFPFDIDTMDQKLICIVSQKS